FLLCLKNYVRNRRYPEGAIAEGRWIDELMTFSSWYLDEVETKSNPPLRNDVLSNEKTDQEGRRSSREKEFKLDDITRAQAHKYVLFNSTSTTSYRDDHIKEIKKENPRLSRHNVERIHNEGFQLWFRNHVEKMHMGGEKKSEDIQILAIGPLIQAKRMTGYICDGVRYLTESRDVKRKTQNSGIMLKAITQSYASTKDKNPILAEVSFYGILTDIIELYYSKNLKFVLFKCKWVNNNNGHIEKDDYGFTLVNFNHLLYTRHQLSDEPFIFASQAQQVFYVDHPMEKEWRIVVKLKPRGFYDLGDNTPTIEHKEGHMELWPEKQLDDTTFETEKGIEWLLRNFVYDSSEQQKQQIRSMSIPQPPQNWPQNEGDESHDTKNHLDSEQQKQQIGSMSMPQPPKNWPQNERDESYDTKNLPDSNESEEHSKRTTGPTMMHSGWGKYGGNLHIELNEHGQVIGSEGTRLSSKLGMLARNGILAPLNHKYWRLVPSMYKDRIWAHIKENTDATDDMKRILMMSFGSIWKDSKHEAKTIGYDP
ncbi:hypothetical protein MTR67_043347, partial [Solanum verrucosum]